MCERNSGPSACVIPGAILSILSRARSIWVTSGRSPLNGLTSSPKAPTAGGIFTKAKKNGPTHCRSALLQHFRSSNTAIPIAEFALSVVLFIAAIASPSLYGAYLYADYGSGEVWALRNNGTNVTQNSVIFTDAAAKFSAFGVDPSNGDALYAAPRGKATIPRSIVSSTTPPPMARPCPLTLAATGVFTNLTSLAVRPGIVPYDVNVPFWSDNAIKSRWISVPNTSLTVGFNRENNWSFPTGTVWIKHFELELTNGVPASRKRLETRLLVKNTNGVYGVTYLWGNSTTNATLVPEAGTNETFVIDTGGGILRTQVWHYPSRVECLQCHTFSGGYALGFNTAQLNKDFDYNGVITNQIAALSLAGYFNTNVTGLHTLRALAHPSDVSVSLEYRARSYLAANCVQCHQPGGPARANWDARLTTITANAGLVKGSLLNDNGNTNNRVLAPGSIPNSMLLSRISNPGAGRMPPLASNELDTNAISLFSNWITNALPSYQTFADWQIAKFGSTNAPNAAAYSDPDNDGADNYLEYLTATDPLAGNNHWDISIQRSGGLAQILFPQLANRAFEVQSTLNLFDTNSWRPLDVTGNEPSFSITNRAGMVNDTIDSGTNKFYRVASRSL